MAHDEHDHPVNTEPPGVSDMFFGAIVFIALTELVNLLVGAMAPGLLSRPALTEIQLSGLLFFFVWWLIGNGIFKPFFEAAHEREASTSGAQKKAQELRRSVQDLEQEISEELGKARLVGVQQRDAKVEAAKRRAQEQVDVAQKQNEKDLKAANKRLLEMREKVEQELAAEVDTLADLVTERALSEKSSSQSVH